jgi:hypothetical protein
MSETPKYPTWDEQHETYRQAKAEFDAAYARWRDNGKVGNPPPRPVRPHTPGWGGHS